MLKRVGILGKAAKATRADLEDNVFAKTVVRNQAVPFARTLVLLSGSGTVSPILDFKSLYGLLCDDFRIAVNETVVNEGLAVPAACPRIDSLEKPDVPMLMFGVRSPGAPP